MTTKKTRTTTAEPDQAPVENPAPSRLPVQTGSSTPRGGRPAVILAPAAVRAAAASMKPDAAIAAELGVSYPTFRKALERDPVAAQAYSEGRAAASAKLADLYEKKLADPKCHPLLILAASNQDPSKGGLGFTTGSSTSGSGKGGDVKINITISRGVDRDKDGRVIAEQDVVDAQYSEVGD